MQLNPADPHLSNFLQNTWSDLDFKELRAQCINNSQQNYIGQKISHGELISIFNSVMGRLKKERQASLESFFLQFIGNLVTGNKRNATMVFGQVFEQKDVGFAERLAMLFDTEKNKKFIHIFFHNLLFALKLDKKWQTIISNPQVKALTKLIFSDLKGHPENHTHKPQPTQQQQANFQWKCSLIKLLYDFPKAQSPISATQFLFSNCISNRVEMAHLLYLLLEKIINCQSTPTLIQGMEPHGEIKELYKKPYDILFLLSVRDAEYLKKCFSETLQEFKKKAGEFLSKEKGQEEQKSPKQQECFEYLFQIVQIFNCITFLGGYNHPVQEIFEPKLEEICELLEIVFIMYSFKRAESLKKTAFKQIPQSSLSDQQLKQLQHRTQVVQSQLSSLPSKLQTLQCLLQSPTPLHPPSIPIYYTQHLNSQQSLGNLLRLLSNLIHINPAAQKFFQVHFKYLYIVLSLTIIDPDQQSMREWSVIFIRNVCEVSVELRRRIEELKVGVTMQ